jgi:hypothetical protein
MIIVEACSQRTPVWNRDIAGDLGVPDWLSQPFQEIARECIRWDPAARISIAEVKELLDQAVFHTTESTDAVIHEGEVHRTPAATAIAAVATMPAEPAVSTLSERVAAVRAAEPDEIRPAARPLFESDTDELRPRSPRLFADIADEEIHESRTGPILFALLALLVIAAVVGFRYRDRIMPLIAKQSAPASSQLTTQQTPQTEAPQNPAGSTKPDQEQAPPTIAPQSAAPVNQPPDSGTASPDQSPKPATSAANPPAQPAQQTQTPPAQSPEETRSQPQPEAPDDTSRHTPAKEEPPPAPRVMNAKGAVLKRLLPSVAPGAFQSMRRPVQVDVRVSVNSKGTVSSAQSVTQSRGNYWARISQQAAEGWKFKPPVSEGQAQASYWMLLFEYNHGRIDVIATQLR